MAYSIGLNSLKKVIAVATALATVTTCLAPKSAQALIRFSGAPNVGQTYYTFDIDTSVADSDPNPNAGRFQGAVQNFKYVVCIDGYPDLPNVPDRCIGNNVVSETVFQAGDLISSQITESDLFPFTVAPSDYLGGVMYEASFTSTDPVFNNGSLALFDPPPLAPNSINSLFSVLRVGLGEVTGTGSNGTFGTGVGPDFIPVDVPEPNATGGLLSAGAIGALLLLKRKKGFTNQKIQNPGIES